MCTYVTTQLAVRGSGKAADGWFGLTDATVYFDHPVHADDEHTLNIDFRNPGRGAGARVAVELSAQSALDLARAILTTLAQVPAGLTGLADSAELARLAEAAGVAGLSVQNPGS
ncbi:MAG TPA: DUF6295 family protein [Actinocrinis sp.]|nr:DUF6295 family protein [Actinocrinis sp.]